MDTTTTSTASIPFRPGPVGRAVRLVLGALVFQSAIGTLLALVDGVSGTPDLDDTGLVIAIVIAAWLTPNVYDVGLGVSGGNRWRVVAGAAIAVTTVVGAAVGAPGTGLTIGILVWVTVTLGWLGLSFLVAAALRTPGCEMRALPHLATLAWRRDRAFIACPGPLQPLDAWEARTSGRAEPYLG